MKRYFIKEVAKAAKFTREDTEIIINEFINQLKLYCGQMQDGEKFTISGFMSFKAMNRANRKIFNPKTNSTYILSDAKNIKVKVTKAFFNSVNNISEFDDAIEDGVEYDDEIGD